MPIREFTTGDKPLDTALNALITTITFDEARSLQLADEIETLCREFSDTVNFRIAVLRHNDELEKKDGYGGITFSEVDRAVLEMFKDLQEFNRHFQWKLFNHYDDRAATICEVATAQQNLAQAIADYATRRGLNQSPTDKPLRDSDLAITEKYRADMKTCAVDDSETT